MSAPRKKCSSCRRERSSSDFYVDRTKRDGLSSRCKSCVKEASSLWAIDNHERAKANVKAWRDRNPDKVAEYNKTWYERNNRRVRAREYAAERRQDPEISEKLREYQRGWRARNPDKVRNYNRNNRASVNRSAQKRRSLERGLPSEPYSWFEIIDRDNWICYLCNTDIPLVVRWQHPLAPSVDHVIPVTDPNCPGDIPSNLRAAHFGCNARKGGFKK